MNKRSGALPKRLEQSLVLVLITLSILSCKGQDLSNLPLEPLPAGEVYVSHAYNKHYGVVTGSRNVYITYGKTSLNEVGGVALSPLKRFRFRIKDLVAKWPEIDSTAVQKAILKQEKELY